ncbi:phage protease [Sphaerotilus sp.]|uniref:phage protease n=1 Tax=Sphaerotilus sp. TaxID=2093942 RepID=UPI00286DA5D8|nr:phage protease [Sphaerotilus sp.]
MPSRLRARPLLALLAASLSLTAAAEVQLLPAGKFSARDGRPGPGQTWTLTDAKGQQIAVALNAQSALTRFLFDIDHQTIRAETNGQPAPAAGWATRFEWRRGQGLYALDATWTDQVRGWIESGQYAYISPVITFDAAGAVTGVLMAAITNYPALLGMDPLGAELSARLQAQFSPDHNPTESRMDLAQLIALLGLATGSDAAAVLSAITSLKVKAEAAPVPLSATIATALGVAPTADEATALTAISTLKGGTSSSTQVIAALQGQLAALTTKLNGDEVEALVATAMSEHKLLPIQRQWAIDTGKRNVAELKAFLAVAPKLLPGVGGQTGGIDPGDAGSTAALSAAQSAVLDNMGVSGTDYAKTYSAKK